MVTGPIVAPVYHLEHNPTSWRLLLRWLLFVPFVLQLHKSVYGPTDHHPVAVRMAYMVALGPYAWLLLTALFIDIGGIIWALLLVGVIDVIGPRLDRWLADRWLRYAVRYPLLVAMIGVGWQAMMVNVPGLIAVLVGMTLILISVAVATVPYALKEVPPSGGLLLGGVVLGGLIGALAASVRILWPQIGVLTSLAVLLIITGASGGHSFGRWGRQHPASANIMLKLLALCYGLWLFLALFA